jgi:Fur family transcriptional regulator, peroxide stress response regulator
MGAANRTLAVLLMSRQVRPTRYRLQILDYLVHNRCHPTAEQIYRVLLAVHPHLSRTTIYNTLSVFADTGIVRVLVIEGDDMRYDITTEKHGHFKCTQCGTIYNFSIDPGLLAPRELVGFQIEDQNVQFQGICPQCLTHNQTIIQ